ncbi:MAG TPA: ABC transporter ATP-binding protein [Bryobacteraceae bacterium]|nr:ABC transporter ATP-binding protein [Bryobacteraceae bacterium]
MLEVRDVSKSYPTPRGPLTILTDVSLSLEQGEAISIVGPSGTGKSTLLYILGALEPPTSGTVTLDGRNPFTLGDKELSAFRNKEVGFVFQDHCLLPQCSVLENVLIPTMVGGGDGAGRARGLLEQVGLSERLDHRPAELSGGEKQRVAIARALIRGPKLLLCDEPTGNLDHETASHVAELLLEMNRSLNTILVVVTHSAELAGRFSKSFEMIEGRLNQRSRERHED